MRLYQFAMLIVAAAVAGACRAKDNAPPDATGTAGSDFAIPGTPADLGIVFHCTPNDVTFRMSGWRKEFKKKETIRFVLSAKGNDYIKITKADVDEPWPFVDSADFVLKDTKSIERTRPDIDAQDTIFHYNVVGVCLRSDGTEDTVVVDPIMILPK